MAQEVQDIRFEIAGDVLGCETDPVIAARRAWDVIQRWVEKCYEPWITLTIGDELFMVDLETDEVVAL